MSRLPEPLGDCTEELICHFSNGKNCPNKRNPLATMIDINSHYTHTDPSTLNLPDLLRTRNDVAARETFVACMARNVSQDALDSPITMNQMGG